MANKYEFYTPFKAKYFDDKISKLSNEEKLNVLLYPFAKCASSFLKERCTVDLVSLSGQRKIDRLYGEFKTKYPDFCLPRDTYGIYFPLCNVFLSVLFKDYIDNVLIAKYGLVLNNRKNGLVSNEFDDSDLCSDKFDNYQIDENNFDLSWYSSAYFINYAIEALKSHRIGTFEKQGMKFDYIVVDFINYMLDTYKASWEHFTVDSLNDFGDVITLSEEKYYAKKMNELKEFIQKQDEYCSRFMSGEPINDILDSSNSENDDLDIAYAYAKMYGEKTSGIITIDRAISKMRRKH